MWDSCCKCLRNIHLAGFSTITTAWLLMHKSFMQRFERCKKDNSMMGTFQLPAAEKPYRDSLCVCVCVHGCTCGEWMMMYCARMQAHIPSNKRIWKQKKRQVGETVVKFIWVYIFYTSCHWIYRSEWNVAQWKVLWSILRADCFIGGALYGAGHLL